MNYWTAPCLVREMNCEDLLNQISVDLEIPITKLKSTSRLREISDKRHTAAFILHRLVGVSSTQTGKLLNRNHSSILHSCRKADELGFIKKEFEKYKLTKIKI